MKIDPRFGLPRTITGADGFWVFIPRPDQPGQSRSRWRRASAFTVGAPGGRVFELRLPRGTDVMEVDDQELLEEARRVLDRL